MSTLNAIKPKYKPIKYYSGDPFDLSFEVTDQDDNPVDLSAERLVFQVKKHKTDPESKAIINISTDSEIIISGVNNSIVTFSGEYAIQQIKYYHDLQIEDGDTLMYGPFDGTLDVTRP